MGPTEAAAVNTAPNSTASTKVVAQGFLGSGPQWFEVWTKAGQRLEYGRTDDARVTLGERADVLTWAANRIEDSLGNATTIHYQATGEQYPLAIRYVEACER